MSDPIPLILCGQSPQIATGVKNGLMPEVEVIHVCLTTDAAVTEIPGILQGKEPSPVDPENIGTKNYSKKPAAVVLGGGYNDEAFAKIREACEGKSDVPWLRPDMSKPTPPLGPEYGKHMVGRVKVCLKELAEGRKMGEDGVHRF